MSTQNLIRQRTRLSSVGEFSLNNPIVAEIPLPSPKNAKKRGPMSPHEEEALRFLMVEDFNKRARRYQLVPAGFFKEPGREHDARYEMWKTYYFDSTIHKRRALMDIPRAVTPEVLKIRQTMPWHWDGLEKYSQCKYPNAWEVYEATPIAWGPSPPTATLVLMRQAETDRQFKELTKKHQKIEAELAECKKDNADLTENCNKAEYNEEAASNRADFAESILVELKVEMMKLQRELEQVKKQKAELSIQNNDLRSLFAVAQRKISELEQLDKKAEDVSAENTKLGSQLAVAREQIVELEKRPTTVVIKQEPTDDISASAGLQRLVSLPSRKAKALGVNGLASASNETAALEVPGTSAAVDQRPPSKDFYDMGAVQRENMVRDEALAIQALEINLKTVDQKKQNDIKCHEENLATLDKAREILRTRIALREEELEEHRQFLDVIRERKEKQNERKRKWAEADRLTEVTGAAAKRAR